MNKNHIAYSMHGAMIGRKDTAGPMGSGFLEANKPSYTLTASNQARHGVVIVLGGTEMVVAYDEFNDSIGDTHHTLRSGTKQSTGVIVESNVRRLTPVECERLQGFPDDWTASQSDSNRYKQMGNAVAVPVVEWIVQNIVDVAESF